MSGRCKPKSAQAITPAAQVSPPFASQLVQQLLIPYFVLTLLHCSEVIPVTTFKSVEPKSELRVRTSCPILFGPFEPFMSKIAETQFVVAFVTGFPSCTDHV